MSFQAYLDNIEEKTGKTPNDFIAEAKEKNLTQSEGNYRLAQAGLRLGFGTCQGPGPCHSKRSGV